MQKSMISVFKYIIAREKRNAFVVEMAFVVIFLV